MTSLRLSGCGRRHWPPPATAGDVRAAERLLRLAGFDPRKLDGKPMPAFRDPLRAFQRAWRRADTGTVNAATLKELRRRVPPASAT